MGKPGEHFLQPGLVKVVYKSSGAPIDPTRAVDASNENIVHVRINDGSPNGLSIHVNRWMPSPGDGYISWKTRMHARPFQDGHCGNFNGREADDDRLAVRQRVGSIGVPAGPELLFGQKTPISNVPGQDLNNCAQSIIDTAMKACAAMAGAPSMSCLADACFGMHEFEHEFGVHGRKLQDNFQFV